MNTENNKEDTKLANHDFLTGLAFERKTYQ